MKLSVIDLGQFVGIAESDCNPMTTKILTNNKNKLIDRFAVAVPCTDLAHVTILNPNSCSFTIESTSFGELS